jgi:uncharacterized protein (TIGR02118 family)
MSRGWPACIEGTALLFAEGDADASTPAVDSLREQREFPANRRNDMAKMLVVYKYPPNPQAFDEHYFGVHIPLAMKLPGLRKYEVSKGPIVHLHGASDTYLIGTLHFDDMRAMERAFASPEGEACALDVSNYARSEDIQMFLFEDQAV